MTGKRGYLGRLVSTHVAWRLGEGDSGKTFLFGMCHAEPVFCVAAGIGDDEGRGHFVTLGRYLIHDRFRCRDFAVVWPADLGDRPIHVIDTAEGEHRMRWLLGDDNAFDEGPEAGGLLDALARPPGPLPAILRRDLDGLFEAFRLPVLPAYSPFLSKEVTPRD